MTAGESLCSLKRLDHSVLQMFLLFIFLILDSLESQGQFINEENPFLIGAVTGAVCVLCTADV